MFLNQEVFSSVIKNTPLISIDLLVYDSDAKILLGKRVNEPAKNYWFVPSGRIHKDETLDSAFVRTTKDELGLSITRDDAIFEGVYEHFYDNNVFDNEFSTHYVVLAHKILVNEELSVNDQHCEYKWFSKDELLKSEYVHKYTKEYFR